MPFFWSHYNNNNYQHHTLIRILLFSIWISTLLHIYKKDKSVYADCIFSLWSTIKMNYVNWFKNILYRYVHHIHLFKLYHHLNTMKIPHISANALIMMHLHNKHQTCFVNSKSERLIPYIHIAWVIVDINICPLVKCVYVFVRLGARSQLICDDDWHSVCACSPAVIPSGESTMLCTFWTDRSAKPPCVFQSLIPHIMWFVSRRLCSGIWLIFCE